MFPEELTSEDMIIMALRYKVCPQPYGVIIYRDEKDNNVVIYKNGIKCATTNYTTLLLDMIYIKQYRFIYKNEDSS